MKYILASIIGLLSFIVLAQDINSITATELQSLAKQVVILDVRSAEEYAEGHVPGAINIAHSEIQERLPELIQFKDQTLVLYCRSGRRAGLAAAILAENQFTQLLHLEGDMQGWQKSDYPIEK